MSRAARWWSVRVDDIDGSREWLCNGLEDMSQALCTVEYGTETEKLHYHAVFISRFSESKIRKLLFSSDLKPTQKSLHLIETEDEIYEAEKYICKGNLGQKGFKEGQNPEIAYKSTIKYSFEFIEKAHNDYWDLNTNLKKEYKEKKLKKNWNFVQEVAFQLQEAKSKTENLIPYDSREWTFRKLVRKYIYKNLREKAKSFDAIIVRRLQNGVMNILDPSGMEEYMERLIDDAVEI